MPTSVPATRRTAAVARLRAAGCVFAEDEVAALLEVAGDADSLDALVARRASGLPLEQVRGFAEFCGIRVAVRAGVFVPRVRTAALVEQAVRGLPRKSLVVDLCCGSGALGAVVATRLPGVTLHAADIDPAAVACAVENLAQFGAQVHAGDLFAALPADLRGHIDLLIANVPYVPSAEIALLPAEARLFESGVALDGGPDGLHVLRRVATEAPTWLAPGGRLLMEVSGHQADAARAALRQAGLGADLVTDEDLSATVLIGTRPG